MISHDALQVFKEHVLAEYPKEACGVLVNGNYHPCKNISDDPLRHFQIAAAELAAITAKSGRIEAILHSHPFASSNPPKWPAEWPSGHDMEQWMKSNIPWGIVGTEGENISEMVWLNESVIAPIEGRRFTHGIWDCYAVVRDWYRLERGIALPNYARSMEWWEKGQNLYEDNFRNAGFVEVTQAEAGVGTALLMQVRSPVINHAAVITGNNEITHHLFHRYSGRDRFDRWERMVAKYLNFKGNQ